MASRLKLQKELLKVLGNNNVYFQPPESFKMSYPCVRYSLDKIGQDYADDKTYIKTRRYHLLFITKDADDLTVDRLLNHFQNIEVDRMYTSDNLYHTSLFLYY